MAEQEVPQAAKRVLKSLITLDSYEPELSDNMQNESIWNEMNPHESLSLAERRQDSRGSESDDTTGSINSKEEREKTQQEIEFEEAEAERDAALPEEFRKFRPRGYSFKIPPSDRPVRIYADGVFDLFHLGHMKQLEQAKKSLPNVEMVVGVPNDSLVHKLKGLTVLSDTQRYESLRHCRWVDEVIPDAPWEVDAEFLKDHNIDYVAHDDMPYAGPDGQDDVYKFVKEQGKFMTTQRTGGISTSDIITRIVKDYDLYLMRNFQRGVSRKELNVSWMKKNELDIKRHVNAFRKSWRHNVETTTRDIYADLLSFAINAPSNSVVGRARDWVSRRMESHTNSPHESDSDSGSASPASFKGFVASSETDTDSYDQSEQDSSSRKKRRVSSNPEN